MTVTLVGRVKLEHRCVFYGTAAAKAFENQRRNQQHLVRGSSHFINRAQQHKPTRGYELINW